MEWVNSEKYGVSVIDIKIDFFQKKKTKIQNRPFRALSLEMISSYDNRSFPLFMDALYNESSN